MNNGNWVPLCKNAAQFLPKDRPYTKLEAIYSLQLDYDDNNDVTVNGYAKLWKWNRKTVRNFIDRNGFEIIYHHHRRGLLIIRKA